MITQKPISVRLDYDRLQDIQQERFVSGMTVNRIINDGVNFYCKIMDARRRYAMFGKQGAWNEICAQLTLTELRFR